MNKAGSATARRGAGRGPSRPCGVRGNGYRGRSCGPRSERREESRFGEPASRYGISVPATEGFQIERVPRRSPFVSPFLREGRKTARGVPPAGIFGEGKVASAKEKAPRAGRQNLAFGIVCLTAPDRSGRSGRGPRPRPALASTAALPSSPFLGEAVDHLDDPAGDLAELGFTEAARGTCGGAETDSAGDRRLFGVEGDAVLVAGDVGAAERLSVALPFTPLSRRSTGIEMRVGAAGDDVEGAPSTRHQGRRARWPRA